MDVHGILSAPTPTSATASAPIDVKFDIDADASQADLEALIAQSQKRSAVFDALTNPTNINVKVN